MQKLSEEEELCTLESLWRKCLDYSQARKTAVFELKPKMTKERGQQETFVVLVYSLASRKSNTKLHKIIMSLPRAVYVQEKKYLDTALATHSQGK